MIGGWNRICFVQHAATIFRMETSRYFLPANLDGAGPRLRRTVSSRSLTVEARVRSQASECGICGGRVGAGKCSASSPSAFRCQFHSFNAP